MTLKQFRKNPELVKQFLALRDIPIYKLLLEVLHSEHPTRYDSLDWGLEKRGLWQSRVAGFESALSIINLMGKSETAKPNLISTYQDPNPKKEALLDEMVPPEQPKQES